MFQQMYRCLRSILKDCQQLSDQRQWYKKKKSEKIVQINGKKLLKKKKIGVTYYTLIIHLC